MKISFFITICFLNSAKSDQVVLLDTTKEATLEWTRYPYGPQTLTPGWVEESFTNFGRGINWRSYVVCDVAYNNVNNWLWSPFIDRGPANRLYIEIQFTIRDCSLFPGNALSCKETFSLLFYEFDAATREPPPWQPESYKLIARIAAGEGRFNQNADVDINTEVKSIAVTKKGVYFAFRDQGACISVLAVKVYYITCPAVTENFAYFNETPTGREITLIEKQNGSCIENAEVDEIPPTYLCKGDGKWTILSGGCRCKVGYEPDKEKQICRECPPGSYRSSEITKCTKCPLNSSSIAPGSEYCKCDKNFYRNTSGNHLPCYRPPGPPKNLTVIFVDSNTVVISWDPPSADSNVLYSLKCNLCPTQSVFQPSTIIFNETKITISNLEPSTSYIVQVFSHSSDKDITGNYSEIFFTTENTISSEILKASIHRVSSKEIFLNWKKPFINVEFYEIRWFVKGSDLFDSNNTFTARTKEEEYVIQNLSQSTEYGMQVRWKSPNGFGPFSNILYAVTQNGIINTIYDDSAQMRIYAGATIAIVVILVLIIFTTIFFFRTKNHDELEKKVTNHLPLSMDYASNEVNSLDSTPIVKSKTNVTTPLFNTSRTYVDPHTYEDPNQAIREFAREIDASYITIEAIIGGGEFGDVCRGRLKIPPNFLQDIDVAIKTLKPGSSEKARCDFLTEASIMGQFDHPNVIYLQGVVTRSNPVMIITEFMENGSLDTFLRANDGKFQTLQLIGMLRGISSGMAYLSDMNYVHRDLAARNVLVNAQLICKIADFGLSREIENASDAYTTRGGKIPVRWTAPEAIAFRKFTSASDVWSYGVVLWEVMSYGERPYWNWSNQDVIKSIEKGYRLPAPMDCPEALYQLMLDCWQKQRTHRPSFTSIVSTLDNLARQPHILVASMMTTTATTTATKNSPDECNFGGSDEPQQAPGYNLFISTDLWLENIKMTRYSQHFKDSNLVTAQQISRLTAQQLTDMGITLVGHQKKIIHQARQLDTII